MVRDGKIFIWKWSELTVSFKFINLPLTIVTNHKSLNGSAAWMGRLQQFKIFKFSIYQNINVFVGLI